MQHDRPAKCRGTHTPYHRITGALPIAYHIFAALARGFSKIAVFCIFYLDILFTSC